MTSVVHAGRRAAHLPGRSCDVGLAHAHAVDDASDVHRLGREGARMSILKSFADALTGGGVEVVDLTAPLSAETPVIQLPPEFAQTARFRLEELSRYDDRGPAWYWNDIHTGEHTGTHLDAPNHWVTGRDGPDVSRVPTTTMVAPVAVIDMTAEVDADPDFLLEVAHLEKWQAEHGPLPDGGWLLYRTGWSSRGATQEEFMNA